MKNIISPAVAAVHFMKGERIAYPTPGQNKLAILREIKAGYPEGEPRYAFFYEDRSTGPDNGKFLHFSASGAIRQALKAGRRLSVQELVPVAEIRDVEDPAPLAPGLPLVPLGPNRTRDGREARVICNDLKNPRYQVVYVIVTDEGEEYDSRFVSATGSYLNNDREHEWDLVGHLPPEPVKPKELWSNGTMDVCIEKPADAEERGFRLFREVLPAAEEELEDLRRWKREQMAVESQWDLQAFGRELGMTIGTDIRKNLLPEILKLKGCIPSGKQFHAWVSEDGESIMGAPDIDEAWATGKGYRKAVLMEVKPS